MRIIVTYIMSNQKNIHVTPSGDNWEVIREGAKQPSFTASTQKEAERLGRNLSHLEKGELFVHGKDGKILRRDSHGNDPCPPQDKR